jgi:hypothetical protein
MRQEQGAEMPLMSVSFLDEQEAMMVVAMSKQKNEALLGLPETERQESEGNQIQGMAV